MYASIGSAVYGRLTPETLLVSGGSVLREVFGTIYTGVSHTLGDLETVNHLPVVKVVLDHSQIVRHGVEHLVV